MRKNIVHLSKKILKHELVSGSTYYFVGSLIGNVFAFLFNLFLARRLTPQDYGIYASLISLFSLITLIPQSFLATVVQFATGYFSKNEISKAKELYRQTSLFIIIGGGIIFFSIIFASSAILTFLHISNVWLIVIVGVLILTFFVFSVNVAYLQSLLLFGFVSFIQAIGAAIKLIFGIVFVLLGFQIFGALGAIFFSFLIPFLATFIQLKFLFVPSKEKVHVSIEEMIRYALPSMIALIALSSFISTDVILAKHFLSGLEAGQYAGLSLVGKVIFYFTGIIPTVMFPVLIRRSAKGHNVQQTFYLGLLLVAIPSVAITIFYFLFPQLVLMIFLGGKSYVHVANNLGFMALFILLYSMITVMTNFFLSLKQTKIMLPIVLMAFLQVISIYFFHKTILQIIIDSLFVSSGLIIILVLYYIYHHTIAKTYLPRLTLPQEM